MAFKRITRAYVILVSAVSVVSLVYIYAYAPKSMFVSAQGVPHFTPSVAHPETGRPLSVGELIRHYKGD